MTISEIKKLLAEDQGYKKIYNNSMYPFPCSCCKTMIPQGGQFVFMGDKKRVCVEKCQAQIIEWLEED